MRTGPARRLAAAVLAVAPALAPGAIAGCRHARDAQAPGEWAPNRHNYAAFRAGRGDVLEPNYLPFMLYRAPDPRGGADLLFFCRWDADRMPLGVYVEPPELDALQDEFHPTSPLLYVAAVRRALDVWEESLEGAVSFRRAESRDEADVYVRIIGEAGPEEVAGAQVMGRVSLGDACRVTGPPAAGRLSVRFAVPELRLFVADEHGLLTPEQLQAVALHEIGHALGMRQHSPIPADLMFPMVRDRGRVVDLSPEDVNSFLSLYRIPNGTLYGRAEATPAPEEPPGPPRLAMAPHVDTRLGFAVRPPAGWLRMETPHGFAAVHGTSWDYDASFQVIVAPYPTIAAYLDRYGAAHFSGRRPLGHARIVVNGRPAYQVWLEDLEGRFAEEYVFVELGDSRVLIVIADCPPEEMDAWRPWFQRSLGSLEFLTERGWEGPEGEEEEAP